MSIKHWAQLSVGAGWDLCVCVCVFWYKAHNIFCLHYNFYFIEILSKLYWFIEHQNKSSTVLLWFSQCGTMMMSCLWVESQWADCTTELQCFISASCTEHIILHHYNSKTKTLTQRRSSLAALITFPGIGLGTTVFLGMNHVFWILPLLIPWCLYIIQYVYVSS